MRDFRPQSQAAIFQTSLAPPQLKPRAAFWWDQSIGRSVASSDLGVSARGWGPARSASTISGATQESRNNLPNLFRHRPLEAGGCQSDANCSPLGTIQPSRARSQAARFCHSARAAERRSLYVCRYWTWAFLSCAVALRSAPEQVSPDDLAHDFVRTARNPGNARVDIGLRDRVLGHVAVASEELEALIDHPAIEFCC